MTNNQQCRSRSQMLVSDLVLQTKNLIPSSKSIYESQLPWIKKKDSIYVLGNFEMKADYKI